MGRWLALLLMFLPSKLKGALLRRLGHSVDKTSYIGFCYLNVRKISIGPHAYVGHGNLFTRIDYLELAEGSRINRWNHFTSAQQYKGYLKLGARSAITLRHYFDLSGGVSVGSDCIVAGHRSTFFTHSKGTSTQETYLKPIEIGDWCYVGSNVCAPPGVTVPDHCFIGMGSVLVGDYSRFPYSLLAGNPAVAKRQIAADAGYFSEGPMKQPQMSSHV